jgi:hypothetical protein
MEPLTGHELINKILQLKLVQVDNDNWDTYYLDNISSEKWVREYLNSELHGGGAPQLRKLEKFPWE